MYLDQDNYLQPNSQIHTEQINEDALSAAQCLHHDKGSFLFHTPHFS